MYEVFEMLVSPDTYDSFLAPVIMSKIPQELRILISRDMPSGEWKLEPLLKIFNAELKLREKCVLVGGTTMTTIFIIYQCNSCLVDRKQEYSIMVYIM